MKKILFLLLYVLSVFVTSGYSMDKDDNSVSESTIKPGVYYVIPRSLNVRVAPSLNAKVITSVKKDFEVNVYEVKNDWAKISNNDSNPMWVFAQFLISCKVLDPDLSASYTGECRDGFAHGKGVATGIDVYKGSFDKGNAHGFGVYEWGETRKRWAGHRYEGGFKNGFRAGHGVYTSPKGYREEGEFKGGNLNGKGVVTRVNGSRYEGEFKDHKRNGYGIYTAPNGSRYQGEFKDDAQYGYAYLYFKDSEKLSFLKPYSKYDNEEYILTGIWNKGYLSYVCSAKDDCKKIDCRLDDNCNTQDVNVVQTTLENELNEDKYSSEQQKQIFDKNFKEKPFFVAGTITDVGVKTLSQKKYIRLKTSKSHYIDVYPIYDFDLLEYPVGETVKFIGVWNELVTGAMLKSEMRNAIDLNR